LRQFRVLPAQLCDKEQLGCSRQNDCLTFKSESEIVMNKYLIAVVATIGIALSAGSALACSKLNSASTESKPVPNTQQPAPETNQQPG